jgi:hypothetical protein
MVIGVDFIALMTLLTRLHVDIFQRAKFTELKYIYNLEAHAPPQKHSTVCDCSFLRHPPLLAQEK